MQHQPITPADQPSVEDRIAATRAALAADSAIPPSQFIRDLNAQADRLHRSVGRNFYNTPRGRR